MKYVYIYFYLKEEKKERNETLSFLFSTKCVFATTRNKLFFMFIAKNYSIEYSIVINDYYYDYWANINYTALK